MVNYVYMRKIGTIDTNKIIFNTLFKYNFWINRHRSQTQLCSSYTSGIIKRETKHYKFDKKSKAIELWNTWVWIIACPTIQIVTRVQMLISTTKSLSMLLETRCNQNCKLYTWIADQRYKTKNWSNSYTCRHIKVHQIKIETQINTKDKEIIQENTEFRAWNHRAL